MKSAPRVIDIGHHFTRYPAGRFTGDGPYSGEHFRMQYLVPIMEAEERAIIKLDGTAGYGSSFLEEAFGGLVRLGYMKDKVLAAFIFETKDPSLKEEITAYIQHA